MNNVQRFVVIAVRKFTNFLYTYFSVLLFYYAVPVDLECNFN